MASVKGSTALAFTRQWHHVDASQRTLGKLAARVAYVLMGKHKPTYSPHVDAGDYVTITNADKVYLSGRKSRDKVYYHHSGFVSGLKEVPISRIRERRGEEIIRRAVSGMLPKNTFRDRRLARLRLTTGATNPYEENVLKVYKPSEASASPSSSVTSA